MPRISPQAPPSPAVDIERLRRLMHPALPGWRAALVDVCSSTNDLLMAEPWQPGMPSQLLIASRQTAGRGRRGRRWTSSDGASLTFSLRHAFSLAPSALAGLSLALGCALAEALEREGGPVLQLKWPNDLWYDGGKLGGVLIELSSPHASTSLVVAGVGINLTVPEAAAQFDYPMSSLARSAAALDRENLMLALCRGADAAFQEFEAKGFAPFRTRWNARNLHAEQEVSTHGGGEPLAGRCIGVDEDGALLIQTPLGRRRVLAGDISLRAGGAA